ncbi:MAG: hypothetical protein ACR2P3_12980 [Geminicoccaceae bacterium]
MSASPAVKWLQRKRKTGGVETKPMHGHPPAKLALHRDRLLRLVAEEPDLTLRQIGECFAADGIHISKSCLHTFHWRNRVRLRKDRPRGGAEPSGRQETLGENCGSHIRLLVLIIDQKEILLGLYYLNGWCCYICFRSMHQRLSLPMQQWLKRI